MSWFDNLDAIAPLQLAEGIAARVWGGERAALAAIELAPGAVLPEHAHHNEQIGFLLRGSLSFRIGDELRELGPGATWVVPPATPHEVRVGAQGALLFELFAPPRLDWIGLPKLPPRADRDL